METKRVDTAAAAALQEVATLQKVLALQQKESIRLQEQVNQLEGELDETRIIAEKRQKFINHANDKISERDNTIRLLEDNLKAAKVEGKAFEKFSSQNKMLLESYLAEQKESEKAKEELDKISFHAKNLKISIEERAKELTSKEAAFNSEIRHLKETAARIEKEKNILKDTIQLQIIQIEELNMKLRLNNELRSEEIARSRQTEYKTLLRAEMTSLALQRVADEKEMLIESVNLASTRARALDDRLAKVSNTAHENEDMLHAFVAKAEDNSNVWRVEERKLRKENDALIAKLDTMKVAMRSVTLRNQALEEQLAAQTKFVQSKKLGLSASREIGSSHASGKHSRLSKSLKDDRRFNFNSSVDNASHETESELLVAENSLGTGLNQSSLLSIGDESTMHSSDMYKSLDTMQYQGKRSLLAKHLRHIVTLYNTLSVPESLKSQACDLSRCALTDDDASQVIDWLRLMSIKGLTLLDLRSNLLTGKGCLLLATYLLSLGGEELLQRTQTLEINCQYNMVTLTDIPKILSYLIRSPRPEIKHIDTECGGQVIVVYGHPKSVAGNSAALLRWNFEFNGKLANKGQMQTITS